MSRDASRDAASAINPEIDVALDAVRLDEIARLAALAASYWHSVELAADRGNTLTVVTHCRQVASVTRDAFAIVKTLGSKEIEVVSGDEDQPYLADIAKQMEGLDFGDLTPEASKAKSKPTGAKVKNMRAKTKKAKSASVADDEAEAADYTSSTVVPEGGPSPDEIFSERDVIAKRIADLKRFDEPAARAIIADATKANLSDLAIETLIKPLANTLGISASAAKKFWTEAKEEAIGAANAANAKGNAEEHERFERELAEQRQREKAEEHDRLWSSCREIAESQTLLADMEEVARKLGLVGEGASIRGAYLTASSRFNKESAINLLRRGAPAGGKNYVIDRTFVLIPADDIVRMSSGSPLSLVYYGGEDEDALKHKIIYVPEAAVIAEKNGTESPLTIMLRILISEGRLDHNVAVPQADGPPETLHIKRNGPVAVIITSARDNVEDELLTRLMTSDADESREQTLAVLSDVLSMEGRGVNDEEIEPWLDLQRWLAIEAPYEVAVPFRWAIKEAFDERLKQAERRGENPKIQLRLRRDVHGMLTAIKTSAILHKAQREKDARGRIVATIADYRHAHEAFDEGLAHLYKTKTPETALAVVKAIEDMGATDAIGVRVTVSALMLRLGISGRGAAADRLKDAQDRGFIELVDRLSGYGLHNAPRIHGSKIV